MTGRLSHSDMAVEISRLLSGKVAWLQRFSGGRDKRPDHELERVRRERDALQQARDDYERAASRKDTLT